MVRFWCLYVAAIVRGWFYRWPSMPGAPSGYSGVSCGLRSVGDCIAMYKLGWEPWSVQRTTIPEARIARGFRVKMTAEQLAHEDAMTRAYLDDAGTH